MKNDRTSFTGDLFHHQTEGMAYYPVPQDCTEIHIKPRRKMSQQIGWMKKSWKKADTQKIDMFWKWSIWRHNNIIISQIRIRWLRSVTIFGRFGPHRMLTGLGCGGVLDGGIKRPWWRHRLETFSAFLALCEGNPPVTGGFPTQRPETRNWSFLWSTPEQTVEQTIETLVILNAITLHMTSL